MSQLLKEYAAPVVWKFTPEKYRTLIQVEKYLEEKCCDSSREARSYATCWALATTNQTLHSTLRGREGKQTNRHQGHSNCS